MKIRKGMWVLHEGKTAIVANLDAVAAEIHFTNPAGLSIANTIVAVGELTQATLAAIPAPRRPAAAAAARLGYL